MSFEFMRNCSPVWPGWMTERRQTTRTCNRCKVLKPLGDYYLDDRRPLGRSYCCKECTKAQVKASRRASSSSAGATRHE